MSERRDADFLTDIQEAINRIKKYTTGITYTDFLAIRKHRTPSYATWKLSARRPRISAGICGTSTGRFPGKAWPG